MLPPKLPLDQTPLSNFSVRDHIFRFKSKDINTDMLPPFSCFQELDSLRKQSGNTVSDIANTTSENEDAGNLREERGELSGPEACAVIRSGIFPATTNMLESSAEFEATEINPTRLTKYTSTLPIKKRRPVVEDAGNLREERGELSGPEACAVIRSGIFPATTNILKSSAEFEATKTDPTRLTKYTSTLPIKKRRPVVEYAGNLREERGELSGPEACAVIRSGIFPATTNMLESSAEFEATETYPTRLTKYTSTLPIKKRRPVVEDAGNLREERGEQSGPKACAVIRSGIFQATTNMLESSAVFEATKTEPTRLTKYTSTLPIKKRRPVVEDAGNLREERGELSGPEACAVIHSGIFPATTNMLESSAEFETIETNPTRLTKYTSTLPIKKRRSIVCPVCNTFTALPSTTLNAHIDKCLDGGSTPKLIESSSSPRKRSVPEKIKLLSNISATKRPCTLLKQKKAVRGSLQRDDGAGGSKLQQLNAFGILPSWGGSKKRSGCTIDVNNESTMEVNVARELQVESSQPKLHDKRHSAKKAKISKHPIKRAKSNGQRIGDVRSSKELSNKKVKVTRQSKVERRNISHGRSSGTNSGVAAGTSLSTPKTDFFEPKMILHNTGEPSTRDEGKHVFRLMGKNLIVVNKDEDV